MVTLWTVEAIAHGADVVSYFRWRQARFAQEQMHAGLLRPDRSRADAWAEVETVVEILAALEGLDLPPPRAAVAMVVDVTAQWVSEIEVQGKGYNTNTLQFQFYKVLRKLGVAVDIVGPDADLRRYQLVVVPSLPIVPKTLINACQSTGALVLFGPRSGAKTDEFQIPADCAPGVLQQLIEVRVNSVETLRPEVTEPFTYRGEPVHSRLWCEDLTVGNAEVAAHYQEDRPALVRGGRFAYLATLTDDAFLDLLLADLLEECGIGSNPPPKDVRLMRRGEVTFAWNYGNVPRQIDLPWGATLLWGNREMAAHGVCIWRESDAR
jgi:beta-galactosidase